MVHKISEEERNVDPLKERIAMARVNARIRAEQKPKCGDSAKHDDSKNHAIVGNRES